MHGVTESQYEDTDFVLTETLNELLQEKLTDVDIDRRHRIGNLKRANNQGLSSSSLSNITLETVVKNKKKLKDTGISITDSLTQKRMQMLTKASNEFLFKNV